MGIRRQPNRAGRLTGVPSPAVYQTAGSNTMTSQFAARSPDPPAHSLERPKRAISEARARRRGPSLEEE